MATGSLLTAYPSAYPYCVLIKYTRFGVILSCQINGDPGRTDRDPLLRRQMLYPAELRDRA